MLISYATKANPHVTTHIECDRILLRGNVISFVTPFSIYSFDVSELDELVIERKK